jgi:hypothetical protein
MGLDIRIGGLERAPERVEDREVKDGGVGVGALRRESWWWLSQTLWLFDGGLDLRWRDGRGPT